MLLKALRTSFFNRFLFTISIRSRLLLYFICLILLPTSVISITLYYKSTNIITNKINASLEEKLNIIESSILQKFDTINDISTEIYLNPDLIRILSSRHPYDMTEIISEMSVIDRLLENYSVTSITQTLLVPRIYILNRPEYLMYSFSNKVSDISVIEKEKWYRDLPRKTRYAVVGLDKVTVSSKTIDTIKIAKRLYGLDDMNIQFGGVLTMDLDIDYFNKILNSSKPTAGSSTFVIDHNQSILLGSDISDLGRNVSGEEYMRKITESSLKQSSSFIEKTNQDGILVSYRKIAPLDWTIVSLTPMSELNRELVTFNRVILFVILLCSILAILMALVLSDNISYPIRKLVKSMGKVQNGNFDISLEYKRNDEFAYLFNTYKKMVHDIKELINKLYISEVNKKEAELKSLQAQINPHFLYNTLDSVNWMALELGAANISTMVTSLSNFFRYSLSKGKNIIPLGDEKNQVESYLKIQKIRFQEKLDYTIDFPSDIHGYLTVKLILQPLVENSILHGINKRRGKGIITITGEKLDSLIVVKISDNGVGADVEELNSILEDRGSSTSFAIKNVNDRIKHSFGNEYGIRFYANEEAGITVTVTFPAVKTMEGL